MADFYYFMAAYLPIGKKVFHVHSILSCNFCLLSYRKGAFQRLFVILDISKGGISGTVTDVLVIFQAAIKGNASGIICAHNHPSSNINPSESDNKITEKIKAAGNLLDIQLLDHLILTTEGDYYSYADNGLL